MLIISDAQLQKSTSRTPDISSAGGCVSISQSPKKLPSSLNELKGKSLRSGRLIILENNATSGNAPFRKPQVIAFFTPKHVPQEVTNSMNYGADMDEDVLCCYF